MKTKKLKKKIGGSTQERLRRELQKRKIEKQLKIQQAAHDFGAQKAEEYAKSMTNNINEMEQYAQAFADHFAISISTNKNGKVSYKMVEKQGLNSNKMVSIKGIVGFNKPTNELNGPIDFESYLANEKKSKTFPSPSDIVEALESSSNVEKQGPNRSKTKTRRRGKRGKK